MSQESQSQETNPEQGGKQEQLASLAEAFAAFTESTASLEASYQLLEERVQTLDAELQAKNDELATTTEFLNSILDGMSDGVVVVDGENRVTRINRAASEMLGVEAGQARAMTPDTLLGTDLATLVRLREIELPTGEGASVPVSAKSSPITNDHGETVGTVTVFQDLRELESLRQQVRQRDRLAAIGEMAATVAHEIRNPLGGIQGFASLLSRDLDPESDGHRLVEKIVLGTKNLNRIVNNLLEYTRPVEFDLADTQLKEIVVSAIGYCAIPDTVTISNEVSESLVVRCDGNQIRQVVLNVLINAVQSMDDAGTVSLTAELTEGAMVLRIRDTGCGIEADELEQIFMPFHTTKEKGTGLGLAAAAKIVEAHGGRIDVDSVVGTGTTFSIYLPAQR